MTGSSGDEAGDATSETAGVVVLLVDDDPMIGDVIAACLEFTGTDVRVAHSLEQARPMLTEALDWVVLDRRLPDGDGLDLLPSIRSRSPRAEAVTFSAFDDVANTEIRQLSKTDIASLVNLIAPEQGHTASGSSPGR